LAALPAPDMPVAETMEIAAGSTSRSRSSGTMGRIAAVEWQPGLATSRAALTASRFSSVLPLKLERLVGMAVPGLVGRRILQAEVGRKVDDL
jgi:hypothetical protein